MQGLRDQGLEVFHRALLRAFDLGCRPHDGIWLEVQEDFILAATFFEAAQTPGLSGGYTSNVRLQALALLEAASVGIDAGTDRDLDVSLQAAAKSEHLFRALKDPLGVAAARVPLRVNSRAVARFELGFDLAALLERGAEAVRIPRVREAMVARKTDVEEYGGRYGHVFPERDALALTIYHGAVGFRPWRHAFHRGQRESLPHFELEIAAIVVAYLVGVATAVTSELVKDLINAKKSTESASKEFVTRAELDRKLQYLLDGYQLREFHLRNPGEVDVQTFQSIWARRSSGRPPVSDEERRVDELLRRFVAENRRSLGGTGKELLEDAKEAVQLVLFSDE